MHAVNHIEITRNALKGDTQGFGQIIKPKTLDFICAANADSDECPTGKSYIPQHFQNESHTYESEASISRALDFFEGAYFKACESIRTGKEENVSIALYFLGRALHCIQDFYAHSSWIFIKKNIGVWTYKKSILDPKTQSNVLYLCYLSPRVTQNFLHEPWVEQDIDRALVGPEKKAKKLNYKRKRDREEWREEILLGPVYHPDIHVDVSFSWASECYKELFGGEKGYFKAKSLATEHTGYIWSKFKSSVGAGGIKLLRAYDADKAKKLKAKATLRSKFDAAMAIH